MIRGVPKVTICTIYMYKLSNSNKNSMIRTSTIRKVVLAGTLLVFPTVMPTVSASVPSLQQSAGEQLTVALKKI